MLITNQESNLYVVGKSLMINKIKGFIRLPYLPYSLFLSAFVIVSIFIYYQLDKNIYPNISNNSALYLLRGCHEITSTIFHSLGIRE